MSRSLACVVGLATFLSIAADAEARRPMGQRHVEGRVGAAPVVPVTTHGARVHAAPAGSQLDEVRLPDDRPPELHAPDGCGKQLGILGGYFFVEVSNTAASYGLTPVGASCAAIQAGQLEGLDVLYVNRLGLGEARSCVAEIDDWVRAGGRLVTEFTASDLVFGTFGYVEGVLDGAIYIPSGNVCGGGSLAVDDRESWLTAGLPDAWDCGGDGTGILRGWDEITASSFSGVRGLRVATRLLVDLDEDGDDEIQSFSFCVDDGSVAVVLTDLGDWQPLDDDRGDPDCDVRCERDIQDESLLINAFCRESQCEHVPVPESHCPGGRLGILGDYFFDEVSAFAETRGMAPEGVTCSSIFADDLDGFDVLYVNRFGAVDAQSCVDVIDGWVRDGGLLITEYTASDLLFDTFEYLEGQLWPDVSIPSGHTCGGNAVVVESQSWLTAGISEPWECSGDPVGLLRVWGSIEPGSAGVENLDIAARVMNDANADLEFDALAASMDVGRGQVVAFFSDFGDWTALDATRGVYDCTITCERGPQEEVLFSNALCGELFIPALEMPFRDLTPPTGRDRMPVRNIDY